MNKKKKTILACAIAATCFAAASAIFLFGTVQGVHIRHMMAGSILTSQHPQYARYIIGEEEAKELQEVRTPNDVANSKPIVLTGTTAKSSKSIIETIEDKYFTAKVMIIDDPKTIHLVGTKYENKGQILRDLISQNSGIAGINAGAFSDKSGTGSGGTISGIAIGDGIVLSKENQNVKIVVCGFKKDGTFVTGKYSTSELLNMGVVQAASFGPQLIVDGKDKVTNAINEAYGWAPRTAIGQESDGKVVMIITDGRFYHNKTHRGASMKDMADLLKKYNVVNAMALDGGGSTTMIYKGKLQLQPATDTRFGMRYLPTAFIVTTS